MGCISSCSQGRHIHESKSAVKQEVQAAKTQEEGETVQRLCAGCSRKKKFSVSRHDVFCKKCTRRLHNAADISELDVCQPQNATHLSRYLCISILYTIGQQWREYLLCYSIYYYFNGGPRYNRISKY